MPIRRDVAVGDADVRLARSVAGQAAPCTCDHSVLMAQRRRSSSLPLGSQAILVVDPTCVPLRSLSLMDWSRREVEIRHTPACHPRPQDRWVGSGRPGGGKRGRVRLFAPLIVGFAANAEFASFAFVHPVIRRLESEDHIRVEQGLLRTFGRVMPVLMPLSAGVTVAYAVAGNGGGGDVLRWVASGLVLLSVVTTLAVNVPINAATSRWDPAHPPLDWRATRRRWEQFQAFRTVPLPIAFILICLAISLD
jgi:hypothetical protein